MEIIDNEDTKSHVLWDVVYVNSLAPGKIGNFDDTRNEKYHVEVVISLLFMSIHFIM